tara:strand:+ start:58 stop:495 length:438 start_codon:yes stop_codon:yes gene_type:complete
MSNIRKNNIKKLKEIEEIFANNEIEDLKEFISKRKCLNISNMTLVYLYHIFQATGILTTSLAAGYNNYELIWIGIGFNIAAGLINTFEHINNSISQRILKDIMLIKENKYIDEGLLVDHEKDNNCKKDTFPNLHDMDDTYKNAML